MTGVGAVSNGVGAFRKPRTRHAHQTLAAIVPVLGLLLLGIAHLARVYGIMAMDQMRPGYQSVVAQLFGAVHDRDRLYDVTIGSVLAVLCLSANTSFVGFPRLCRQVAHDGDLPSAFALSGRRLVYTAGILFLTGGAGLLLAAFRGITDRLIPLFAIGAFLSFTLSQAGMAAHWWRHGAGVLGPACEAGRAVPRLVVACSPYRGVIGPLLHTIETLRRREPGRHHNAAAAAGRDALVGAAAAHPPRAPAAPGAAAPWRTGPVRGRRALDHHAALILLLVPWSSRSVRA